MHFPTTCYVALAGISFFIWPFLVQAATTLGTDLTTGGSLSVSGHTVLGNSAADSVLFTSNEIYLEGATNDSFETRVSLIDPTADNSITLQNGSGLVPLSTLGQTLFFSTSGDTTIILPTSGTMCTLAGTETLSNKTLTAVSLTSPVINSSPTAVGAIWDDLGAVTTADINGGTLDGVTIGGASSASGSFTTLSSNGVTALGNNSAAVTINSNDWDVSSTGDMTNIGSLSMDGGLSIGTSGTAIQQHISSGFTNVSSSSINSGSCATYATFTVTGATVGDTVVATPAPTSNGIEDVVLPWFAYISSANTVTIRACNILGILAINTDDTQSWRIDVWQH